MMAFGFVIGDSDSSGSLACPFRVSSSMVALAVLLLLLLMESTGVVVVFVI
jgi:hypothetical protein